MSLAVERKLPLILFTVVIVLTVLGFVLYQYTTSLQATVDTEKRTQQTISRLDEVLRFTLNVDASISSFVITGNDTYLTPYDRAKPGVTQSIAQLRTIMADSPQEVNELVRLESLISNYLAQAQTKIDRRKIDGFDATVTSLGSASDRELTGNIRSSIDRLKAAELTYLQTREKALDQSFNRTILVLIIGCLSGVIALAFANRVVSREIIKRRSAERALTESNKELESRIDERTRELEEANESLRLVATERELFLKNEQSARREAEIATRLRDEFMATVSHELKTPLNSILGWARMLKAGDLDDDQVTKALGTIIKNSETQNRLIEDLLDVARIISGKLMLDLAPIDPSELLHDAIGTSTPAAAAKGIEIVELSNNGDHTTVINGDRNRLMQVFSNLLTNAVKFTPEGGRIDVNVEERDGNVRISVKDNGVGIKPEFLQAVFERFRQDRSTPAQNGGLGLGLAIVRQLVEMHGGTVSVHSEGLGQGSEFIVELPARRREDLQLARPA